MCYWSTKVYFSSSAEQDANSVLQSGWRNSPVFRPAYPGTLRSEVRAWFPVAIRFPWIWWYPNVAAEKASEHQLDATVLCYHVCSFGKWCQVEPQVVTNSLWRCLLLDQRRHQEKRSVSLPYCPFLTKLTQMGTNVNEYTYLLSVIRLVYWICYLDTRDNSDHLRRTFRGHSEILVPGW